jgi:hypothetical protein
MSLHHPLNYRSVRQAMKYSLFTLLFSLACAAAALAQVDPDERSEKVQAMRVAVFTQVLDLTPEEAQNFWPLYNAFLDQREALQKQYKPTKTLDGMTDAEVEDQLRRHFELRERELSLEKETYQKLRKVLPLRKIARLTMAERRFRERIVEIIKENRQRRQERRRN